MIIKSFFRKKSTIIYFIIFSILFAMLFLINIFINYLTKLDDLNFKEESYLYLRSKDNLVTDLLNDSLIENSFSILLFKYTYFDGIAEDQLVNYDLDSVIVYNSEDKNVLLEEEEVIIGLNELDYINKKSFFNNIEKKEIIFETDQRRISLKIKKIINMGRFSGLIISKKLFDKLENENHYYISNIKNEKKIETIIKKYTPKSDEILVLNDTNLLNYNKKLKIKKILDISKFANFVLFATFIIVFLITNRNIISDLSMNLNLEKKVGFKKLQIYLNIIKRLCFLHGISILNSLILVQIVKFALNVKFDLKFDTCIDLYIFNIIIFIIISDLLLSIVVNNKSWKGGEL